MHQAPIHPRILLGAWFFAWIGIATTQAQNLAEPWIQAFTLAPEGNATVRVANLPGTYAILYRGDAVTPIQTATDLATTWVPGIPEFIDLLDPTAVGTSNARFYRVEFVSRLHPKDSDSDGMDDVFELTHGPTLDPLRRSDAFEDPDHDGRSNLAEFRGGTHPLLADPPPPPSSPTLDPTPGATRGLFLELSGEGPPGTDIRIEGGASLATNRVDAAGRFVVPVTLAKDRLNRLFVSAIGPGGSISLGRPLEILQDSQPPTLFADFPTNQMILATAEVMVAGRVGDALSGYAGLKVWVHSAPSEGPTPDSQTRFPDASPWRAVVDVGIGPNGTYERADVPLVPGNNVISVVADDALGNHSIRQINVVRNDPQGPRLVASAGDRQSTEVLRRLTQPIVVRVTQADGSPLANTPLLFEVTRSNGRMLPVESNPPLTDWRSEPSANSHGAMRLSVASDSQGEARVWWTLGSDAGCANNRVCVSSPAISNAVYFCASAKPNSARQLNIGSGHRQKLEVGGLAPEPLRVWASDGLNPSVGVPITFRVVRGRGRLVPGGRDSPVSAATLRGAPSDGSTELTVPTGLTGHASVSFIAGPEPGQQLVEATFPGQFGLPPTFLLEALARDPDLPGTFTGLVLDNTSCPIGGAVCVLATGHSQQSTTTDVQGRFRFDHVPGGMGHLHVNGRVANRLLGASIPTNSFPSLSYSVVTVPNAANSLPTPVLLPRLNPANAVVYYGTNDLVLTCAGIDGLKFTIRANSMTDERGNPVRPENPAVVSLDQVHHDDVPMPMPDGVAPPFAWTFQPGGAHFDPSRPVAVEYPNMSGLAPGSVAYFLSFNHDTERFE
ncbi:MAG: carboxypeptidase regulatory-like domain-containing protein, partial [Verrucomicrobiales bacterium]|nr:carboxypeptidase regulatory-like domain-containing protein [Verrucomicrobiales bacterium]